MQDRVNDQIKKKLDTTASAHVNHENNSIVRLIKQTVSQSIKEIVSIKNDFIHVVPAN